MNVEIARLGLKATRKIFDEPLIELEVDYGRRLTECDRRIRINLLMIERSDMSTDRKIQAIAHVYGVVRLYMSSVPSNQQERYVRGNLMVSNMVTSIDRASAEVLGGRK